MKKKLFIIFGLLCGVLYAQTDRWEYPIEPGMEEWKERPYHENVEKSQPPKELMDGWDTEMLFGYCLDYPFNMVAWMFDNPNAGFMFVYDQATVWQEFIRRKEAPDVFAQYLYNMSFDRLFEIKKTSNSGNELFTIYFLEKIVSETDFTAYLDASGKRKLANAVLQTHQNKKDYPDIFFGYSFNSSLCALVKILESDSANDEISLTALREATDYERFFNNDMDAAITAKVLNYLNK